MDFETVIKLLESESEIELDQLDEFQASGPENSAFYNNLEKKYEKYFKETLKHNPYTLVNVIKNLYKKYNYALSGLHLMITDKLSSLYIAEQYKVLCHDIMAIDSNFYLLDNILMKLSYSHQYDQNILIIKEIAKESKLDINLIMWKFLGHHTAHSGLQISILIGKLTFSERYELLSFCYGTNYLLTYNEISNSLEDVNFQNYVKLKLSLEGDNASFAINLRRFNVPYYSMDMQKLATWLINNRQLIPQTLKHFIDSAEGEKNCKFLILLGSVMDRHRLLNVLLKNENKEYVNKFFKMYGNYSDVKLLKPFL